jgi:hypothetical protein
MFLSSVISSKPNDLDINIVAFQVVVICVLVGGVRCFEGTCCPSLQGQIEYCEATGTLGGGLHSGTTLETTM